MSRLSAIACVVLMSVTALAPRGIASPEGAAVTAVASKSVAGTWQGDVHVPLQTLRIVVRLADDGQALTGTISIPLQGLTDVPLEEVSLEGDVLRFSLASAGAHWEITIAPERNTGEGVLKQSGMEMPTTIRRLAEGESPDPGYKRPQTPHPPFPYATSEVEFLSEFDGARLAGTICVPEGAGPHPAVVFITGSGPQDRDETIFGHKPFLVLADDLARHGVASLRYDDRGVGGSQGDLSLATIDTFAGDVRAALATLAQTPGIDATRIGLIGHSEGGIVAPAVAAGSDDVAFIVLLAGTGVSGAELLKVQLRAILESAGAAPAVIVQQMAQQKKTLELLGDPARADELGAHIREVIAQQMPGQDAFRQEAMSREQLAMVTSPWFRSFIAHDPAPSLRRVRCPVLALDGSRDVQVVPSQNLPAIEAALKEGGNRDVTVRELPGLNHMFQQCRTGSIDEYAQLEQTIDPRVIEMVREWVLARTAISTGE